MQQWSGVMIPMGSDQDFLFWNTPAPLRGIPHTLILLLAFPIQPHKPYSLRTLPALHVVILALIPRPPFQASEGYHHLWIHWVLVPNNPTPKAGYCCSIPRPLSAPAVPISLGLLSVDKTSTVPTPLG